MSAGRGEARKRISENRKARHDYEVLETFEAGLVLLGTEVKALRAGRVTWADSFAEFSGAELFLKNVHIGAYDQAGPFNHEPFRPRKLLLNKRELAHLSRRVEESGLTLVPLELYLKEGRIKLTLALARGRKAHDKREALKEREAKREMDRARRG